MEEMKRTRQEWEQGAANACFHEVDVAERTPRRLKKTEGNVPSYNMKSSIGLTALFFTRKSSIVELLLQFDDIIVTDDLRPLLWRCARHGIITEKIARDRKLTAQFGLTNKGTLALEEGENFIR